MGEGIVLSSALLGALDLKGALADDVGRESDLLPGLVPGYVTASAEDALVKSYASHLRTELPIDTPETVLAQKAKRGMRPLPILSIEETVTYAALVSRLMAVVPANPRRRSHTEFRDGPLEDGDAAYVLMADVSSFFQYIDHGLVRQEIINLSGEDELATVLCTLLRLLSGRHFGIPQSYPPSAPVAELLIDIVERRLLRLGLDVWRYVDDFRIGARTERDAGHALELLDREVRAVGLTLNEEKTSIRSRARYEEWIAQPDELWANLEGEAAEALRDYDPYATGPTEPDRAVVMAAAAEEYLRNWATGKGRARYGYEASVQRQLVGRSYSVLDALGSDLGLAHAAQALIDEPYLTPRICRYLASAGKRDMAPVAEIADDLITRDDYFLSTWQAMWLLEVIEADLGTDVQVAWALEQMSQPRPGVLTASAAVALARKSLVSMAQLGQLYGAVPTASRPVVALAISRLDPGLSDRTTKAVQSENPLNQAIMAAIDPDDIPF